MKTKQSLLARLLLPTVIVLLLLPPLCCLIFHQAAQRSAYAQAVEELRAMRQALIPLMRESFENNEDDPTAQARAFLQQAGPKARRMGGDAQMMILGENMQVIYPRDAEERAAAAPLAEAFAQRLSALEGAQEDAVVDVPGDRSYLADLYEIPARALQLRYLITYCPTDDIGGWVGQASLLVLGIASFLSLVTIAVLWAAARSVIRPLRALCRRARRIGAGDFAPIEPAFALREPEQLRRAMNNMSARLERGDRAQKDFFQNVSHQLRTPLMSIAGYAQGIEQGVFPDPGAAAHTILEESARLTSLVESLLTLSRLESGQQSPPRLPVLLADAVGDCLDRAHGLALQKGVECSASSFPETLAILGDEELLERALENLLTNAIRYARASVLVEARAENGRVSISVSDDGPGISEADMPRLFERCYRGSGGNFGLGLAIARSAARAMDGDIAAANRSQGGAVFTITLEAAPSP